MAWTEETVAWKAGGSPMSVGLTRFGSGPALLLLPALSSISTRAEMRPLQERLGERFATLAIDWPGFGTLPRPKTAWRPENYRAFLRFVLAEIIQPAATIAAGHAAGHALAHAAEAPGALGRLCLLSPTWRGPLPTMTGRRLGVFRALARAVDLPIVGESLYRLNINRPVINMMARGHVYADPSWLTPERMAEKRAVTDAPGARHGSFRFVGGMLDPFHDRPSFLAAAARSGDCLLALQGGDTPRKSKAEMDALAELPNVKAVIMPKGKLSFYEEFPDETARVLIDHLA